MRWKSKDRNKGGKIAYEIKQGETMYRERDMPGTSAPI